MSARNKPVNYRSLGGRSTPIYIDLPVQAGASQEIKIGEICKWRSFTDFSTYPIVPATDGDDQFVPVIATEEQKSTDEARLMRFILPTEDFAFEFDLDSATTLKPGMELEINDSQSLASGSVNPMASVFQDDLLTSAGAGTSVSKVFAVFKRVGFTGLDSMPGIAGGEIRSASSGVLDHADFTDNGDATGKIDTGIDIPANALVIGYKAVVSEPFAGDTSGTMALGDGSDVDRFNGLPDDPSVYSDATVQSFWPAAGALCLSDTSIWLTITGASDWGNVTAGKVQVTVYYTIP